MRLGREGAPHGAAVAARLAARLREELAALEGENDDYDTLFRAADHALYCVKKDGRDGYSIAQRI